MDCVVCGRPIPPGRKGQTCGPICGHERMVREIEQLKCHEGPEYDHYLQAMERVKARGS